MLEAAVEEVYGADNELMRTGTVLSTADRNWEWRTPRELWEWLRGSTAVAIDMESCMLAANGYRYRIPYGTLLSVSDLPLHAVPKLPAGAKLSIQTEGGARRVPCARWRPSQRIPSDSALASCVAPLGRFHFVERGMRLSWIENRRLPRNRFHDPARVVPP